MIKHYIEYLHPGIILSDSSEKQISHRDPQKIKFVDFFGFRFFDREEKQIDGEVLSGKRKNYSGWYYQGEKYDKTDVMKKVKDNSILLRNMENNGYNFVLKTKYNQFIPLEDKDILLRPISNR